MMQYFKLFDLRHGGFQTKLPSLIFFILLLICYIPSTFSPVIAANILNSSSNLSTTVTSESQVNLSGQDNFDKEDDFDIRMKQNWSHANGQIGIVGGTPIQSFSSSRDFRTIVSSLARATTEYSRAQTIGHGMSTEASFNTGIMSPTVITMSATSVMSTTAILNGNLTSTGGAETTVHICGGATDGGISTWERDENLGVRAPGAFSLSITGLTPGTIYYYRCYATNLAGTTWALFTSSFSTQVQLSLWANYWAGPGKDWFWFSSGTSAYLEISADYYKLWKTWKLTPEVKFVTSDGSEYIIAPSNCSWSSSNDNVATVNTSGLITAVSGGAVDIIGAYNGVSKKITLTVVDPISNPVEENIDPYLSTPAQNYVYEMPVVIIRYLPSADGINLDVAYAPGYWSLDPVSLSEMEFSLNLFDKRTKYILEEGSKFHGYKDSDASPSLGYRIVRIITVYEPVSPGNFWYMSGDRKVFYADYNAIFERFGLSSFIEANNVKEVWLNYGYVQPGYPSYNPAIHGPEAMINSVESNMSSPTTGDISNSDGRNNDLPILNHTYTLYDYNIRRSHAENVENHMHQLETLYAYIDWGLFWDKCAGFANDQITAPARCGWTHYPPNGTQGYDWNNETFVSSDIEDWNPDNTGVRKLINSDTWCSIPRNWPDNVNINWSTDYASNWFLYLMQNWPGYANQIPYGSYTMSNWWEFTADWDKAVTSHLGLYIK